MLLPLALLLSACNPSEESENSGGINAQEIEAGKSYNLTITEHAETTKYYSLPVAGGSAYSIDMMNDLASSNTISVQLMADGFEREVLSEGRMISFDYAPSQTGELLIKVTGSSRAFFRYHLTAHPSVDDGLVQDDASYEPNNSRYAAYPIVNGAQYHSTIDMGDDFDWYALDVVNGDSITLWASNDIASTSFLRTQMFDQDGLPLTQEISISHTSDLSTQVVATYTGRVYVKFKGTSPSTPHRYDFSLTLSTN